MHRRRGGKIFSLSRHIQARTNATATRQAVSARTHPQHARLLHTLTHCFTQISVQPSGWDIPNTRPTAPPSPLTTSTPAGLGKWAPPISKWAKPESQKLPTRMEGQKNPIPRRQNQRTFLPSNREHRPEPSVSFTPSRCAPASGRWSRPPGFAPPNPTHSTPAKPSVNDSISDPPKTLKVEEQSGRREWEPRIGESSRSFIQPEGAQQVARQPRRWDGNGMHKSRGSLLSRREGEDVIPHQPRAHGMRATSKPRLQKAKKALRVNPDINIPSTVSVGNFARLLNVSLGKD